MDFEQICLSLPRVWWRYLGLSKWCGVLPPTNIFFSKSCLLFGFLPDFKLSPCSSGDSSSSEPDPRVLFLVMGCDRISHLPDSLLIQILSLLPTKESVRTSVLSTRWQLLWPMVPVLDLIFTDDPEGEASDIFVDEFLEFHQESGTKIQKFKILFDDSNINPDCVEGWICTTVDGGVPHLDVECFEGYKLLQYMPQNIYQSNTLVSLKLAFVGIQSPEFDVSLPRLKVMHLEDISCDDSLIIEKLLSGSPVLEELSLIKLFDHDVRDVVLFLRVRSQTLKRFSFWFTDHIVDTEFSVEIDAPRLEYLSFNDNQSDIIVVKNLNSLSMVDINSKFNVIHGSPLDDPEDMRKRDIIRNFLSGISSVRYMLISEVTLEVLCLYSVFGQIPEFSGLYRLEAEFSKPVLQLLPVFLESCPNLKHLILELSVSTYRLLEVHDSTEPEKVELSNVPVCLLSSLECVEIKRLVIEEETGIKLVNYFLQNSAVLKTLSVSFKDSPVTKQELDAYKNRLTSTKLSRRCQVVFVH